MQPCASRASPVAGVAMSAVVRWQAVNTSEDIRKESVKIDFMAFIVNTNLFYLWY
jgi:hypothetical protein